MSATSSGRDLAVVLSVGARGPLGLDALSYSMAARARLLDVHEISLTDRSGDRIGVARTRSILESVQGVERWLALAAPALSECGSPRAAPLIVAVPDQSRPDRGTFSSKAFLSELATKSGVALDLVASETVGRGHAGGAIALARAVELLATGAHPEVIVGGVDSFIHPLALGWLDDERRLHSMSNENGFIPAEGAAFVRLARRAPAGLQPIATVVGIETAMEDAVASGAPNIGAALTGVVQRLVKLATKPIRWVLVDDNGELHRAEEWGMVSIREPLVRDATRVSIGQYFGDTGAASGPLALAHVCTSMLAGCGQGPSALVALASDGANRGGFLVEDRLP